MFEDQNKFNKTLNRIQFENASVLHKHDNQYFATPDNLNIWWSELKSMMVNYELAWIHYDQNTGASETYDQVPLHFTTLKIQKHYLLKDIMFGMLNMEEHTILHRVLLLFQYI